MTAVRYSSSSPEPSPLSPSPVPSSRPIASIEPTATPTATPGVATTGPREACEPASPAPGATLVVNRPKDCSVVEPGTVFARGRAPAFEWVRLDSSAGVSQFSQADMHGDWTMEVSLGDASQALLSFAAFNDPASSMSVTIYVIEREPDAADRFVARACANSSYEDCELSLRIAMNGAPWSLVAICEYSDAAGDVVLIDKRRQAKAACSANGLIRPSRVHKVLRLP